MMICHSLTMVCEMKVKALGVPNYLIRELDRIPEKDEIFDLSEERARELSSDKNIAKTPLVEIIKDEEKPVIKKKKR